MNEGSLHEDHPPTDSRGPLGPIGICLSGGGYRAAAFHLGALSYLEHLDVATDLIMLSSVSGGTFTAARYAVSQATDESFEDFFGRFYSFLETTDLVRLALQRLADGNVNVPSGRQDVIISAAEIYAETFLRGPDGPWRFGTVLDAVENGDTTLREVIFNTTEFRHGIDFRFQSSGRVGNGNISIPRHVAREMRLADITAMSSCFPGGFEPVAFPFDVHWDGNRVPPDVGDDYFTPDGKPFPLPIMDGGIYDNQGLEALMMANKRADKPLDTIIISDVDQTDDDLYAYPQLDEPTGPTLDTAVLAGWVLAILSLLTFVVTGADLVYRLAEGSARWLHLLTGITGLALAGATFGVLVWLRRESIRGLRRLPQVGVHAWKDLRRLKVEQLSQLLYLRASSLLALTSNVFLKRIRSLVQARYFSNDDYRPKLVSNYVYLLTLDRERERLGRIPGVEVPAEGSELDLVARGAESMATTLWFVSSRGWCQPSLVASGQATLVYALLANLFQRHGGVPPQGPAQELWDRLLADMRRFLDDPYWLLTTLRPGTYPKPPADCSCADALGPGETRPDSLQP